MVIKSMMVGKQEVETFAPFDRAELDNHQHRTPGACRLCTACSLLPANLPLFSRHLQLPATTLQANASMKSLVRRDTGQTYDDYLRQLAAAEGVENASKEQLARLDRKRKKKASNDDWTNPNDPSARIYSPNPQTSTHLFRQLRISWLEDLHGMKSVILAIFIGISALGADVPGSTDPAGMKRYGGSEIIGYRQARFDEYLLPLGRQVTYVPLVFQKSQKVEGLVSRYTYLAPLNRTPAEVMQNYKLEFARLGLVTMYEKAASDQGWFGPTFSEISNQDDLGQILAYNESQERLLVGRSKGPQPTYYEVFVTAYKDGIIPQRLAKAVVKERTMAEIIVIAPQKLEQKMVFVNADEMKRSIAETGKVALYGLYFDTDKDTMRADSALTMDEIAKLMRMNPQMKLRVVGHTDDQGAVAYNLDLSRRRAASVAQQLVSKYGIASSRLDSFGAGLYAPMAPNRTEDGRGKNRRVELVEW